MDSNNFKSSQIEIQYKTCISKVTKLQFTTILHLRNEYIAECQQDTRTGSRLQMFFKMGVLKNIAMFTEKHLCGISFLLKLQALGLQNYLIKAPAQV